MSIDWRAVRLFIRLPFKYLNRFIMPEGLYSRSLIIVILPMIILQTILLFVFMDRHWRSMTQSLSSGVARDISTLVRVIESYPQSSDFSSVIDVSQHSFRLTFSSDESLPEPLPEAFFPMFYNILYGELSRRISYPVWLDVVSYRRHVEIRVELPSSDIMKIYFHRQLATSSNWHIFLVWMVATSIILLIISILFLRNQIKPIESLARAAENFGKGRKMAPDFKVRGALEVRRAGLAFYEMRRRIERSVEQRTAMLTGVSHDLRTVLTRFRLQLALLPESSETKALESDINDMHDMLEAYLDFAKDETDEKVEWVDISELFSRFESDAVKHNCSWSVDSTGDSKVMARPLAMLRLFTNIVVNSFAFADSIRVSIRRRSRWLLIDIDDNGPGIASSMRQEVFRPFVRLDESRNLDSSGSGLGLSIARDIVHNHGGRIELDDSPLGGLRVRVRLPA